LLLATAEVLGRLPLPLGFLIVTRFREKKTQLFGGACYFLS
jgi:hypothetical protein